MHLVTSFVGRENEIVPMPDGLDKHEDAPEQCGRQRREHELRAVI